MVDPCAVRGIMVDQSGIGSILLVEGSPPLATGASPEDIARQLFAEVPADGDDLD